MAARWDSHDVQVNIARGDGRVLSRYGTGDAHDPMNAAGRPATLGAPARCRSSVSSRSGTGGCDSTAWSTSGRATSRSPVVARRRSRRCGCRSTWTCTRPSRRGLTEGCGPRSSGSSRTQDEGALIGGPRFEQLARARGTVTIGDVEHPIDGGALRIRRRGVRRLGTFRGHAWQSALFGSGRAFGYLVFPPRDDGLPTYNEGFVFEGDGDLIPARVVDAHRGSERLRPRGSDVSVVIETGQRDLPRSRPRRSCPPSW